MHLWFVVPLGAGGKRGIHYAWGQFESFYVLINGLQLNMGRSIKEEYEFH